MQDLMNATGLKKGGLYRHFSGKEELAAEAFRYAVARANKLRGLTISIRLRTPSISCVHRCGGSCAYALA